MKKAALFFLMLISCASNLVRAQNFNLIDGREPVASLDGLWRFHLGDNPAWADPHFDDSQSPLLRSNESWAKQGHPGYGGYAWYRFQVAVPANEGDLSLFLPPILTSYQVFVQGKMVKTVGPMPPDGTGVMPLRTMIRLPIAASQEAHSITIALRVWHWPGWANYDGGGPQSGGGLVGQSTLLESQARLHGDSRLLESGGDYTLALAEGIAGLLALLLFLIRRTEWEYLWFAGNSLLNAALFAYRIYSWVFPVAIIMRDWINNLLGLASALCFLAFLVTLLRGRRTVLLYLAVAACFLQILNYTFLEIGLYYVGWVSLVDACLTTIILVWAADLLIRKSREGLPDARLLLVPVLLSLALTPFEDALWGSFQLGWQKTISNPNIHVFVRPFEFSMDDAVMIFFLLAMLAILINRFARTRREEQRLVGELEAARGMQSLLVPATAPSTPGFTVESVYIPASEVGGDFFQILPGDDGSVLIVMGDVSGKGLKAAMTVSTIVGALRGSVIREPAAVLANLNRVLHGQITGFATCVAAWIIADGTLAIANAGHIPPYRNGEELAVQGGLPLGVIETGNYEETQFEIAAGDRLTFVSDGVVEATNEKKELFGFARTQAISHQPAQTIAEAAKTFGQEDDISVLSVTRT